PDFYGLSGRELGLLFRYDYRLHWASQGFEDQFFGYLATAGSTGDPTVWQEFYNDQQSNVLDVTGPVRYMDGPATERTLEAMARQLLGIDTRRSYTIFFVNWHGRADFQFHLYTKTDEADPDTGYNWGAAQSSRKMIARGGTLTRTWFYDLSAGPTLGRTTGSSTSSISLATASRIIACLPSGTTRRAVIESRRS
ncbi:MAG: hypothetical protein ABR609_05635, partial [Acidimicrobiia bacterium]